MSAVLADLCARRADAAAVPDPGTGSAFARDVLAGLSASTRRIPCTWLYDHRGAQLFERITTLDTYYPARIERRLLERCAASIAGAAGAHAVLIELGSGSSRKTPILLGALDAPAAYVPIDVSALLLAESVAALRARFPALAIEPLAADFTQLAALPVLDALAVRGRRVVFLPGSAIGNLEPDAAIALMERIGRAVGPGSLFVIAADATHDPAVLLPAYDDPQGMTAAFNKNLLVRINRELGGDFSPSAFRHEARWNPMRTRVEMHLVAEYTQRVHVGGRSFRFAAGESIHTENAYKHGVVRFQAMARRAGWTQRQLWTDAGARYALHVLEREAQPPACDATVTQT